MDAISFSDLETRRIIWASIDDPQGRNRKVRPAIVFEFDNDESGVPYCWVIGGTTTPVDAERMKYTVLLNGPSGTSQTTDPRTGLTENTLFCAFWLEPVYKDQARSVGKMCPESEFLRLRELIDELDNLSQSEPGNE